jgi:hypothetical protein
VLRLLNLADEGEHLDRVGAEVLRQLVLDRLADLREPLLSTFLTTLTPIFSSFASASCSSLNAAVGSFLLTSSAAACTHFFCSSERLRHALSLMNSAALFASCSVSESTGAGS